MALSQDNAGGAADGIRLGKKRRPPPRLSAGDGEGPNAAASRPHLIIECKYANELPKPPVPKLLKALPAAERLFRYRPTSLELDHRPFLLSEKDLIACVELVDPDAYGSVPSEGSMLPPPPPQDSVLLRDDDVSAEVKENDRKKRKLFERTEAFHREAFGLQLPQLVTNDVFTERQRYTTGLEAAEKKILRDPPGYDSHEDLITRIDKTFELSKEAPVHPVDSSLKPKRILSVVPDAVLWANRYRQVVFDELIQEPKLNDILFKTVPTPRLTCFGYFAPSTAEGADQASYGLAQSYVWDNRGGFTRAVACGEGEAVLLSFPPPGDESGEVRFVLAPPLMHLKKQKAHRLDIMMDTKAIAVTHREPSAQEQAEERDRMATVLSDEGVEHEESTFDFVGGEWIIRGEHRQEVLPIAGPGSSSPHSSASRRSPHPIGVGAAAAAAPGGEESSSVGQGAYGQTSTSGAQTAHGGLSSQGGAGAGLASQAGGAVSSHGGSGAASSGGHASSHGGGTASSSHG